MKTLIRNSGKLLIPKRYRPAVRRWVLSVLGVSADSLLPSPGPVYCGNNRILAQHPCKTFMYLDSTDFAVTPSLVYNVYERHVTEALRLLVKPGFVVVECGANQGFHTLTLASLVGRNGRVLAFEPDPRNIAVLEDNVRAHYLFEVITVIPKAAYHCNGQVPFFRGRSGAHSSLVHLQAAGSIFALYYLPKEQSEMQVEAVTISTVLAETGLVPNFVRLDVEGAEPMALDGMWEYLESYPDIIVMFENNTWCLKQTGYATPETFIRRLLELDMRFWRIESNGTLSQCDPEEIMGKPENQIEDYVACRSPELIPKTSGSSK